MSSVMAPLLITFTFMSLVSGKVGGPQTTTGYHPGRVGLNELRTAMDTVLGCGDKAQQEHLKAAEEALLPMWRTLPKDPTGRVEWRSVRYLAHRYFQRFGLTVRGFEPQRLLNDSYGGHAEILNEHVPHFVELLVQEKSQGFSLDDAAALVVTLEQLMFDSETTALSDAYFRQRVSTKGRLSRRELLEVLKVYVLYWSLDSASAAHAKKNHHWVVSTFPHWEDILNFVAGQVAGLDFARQSQPREAHSLMLNSYSFDDAHKVVGRVTRSFGAFWEPVCQEMKSKLVGMDTGGTGRVSLSKFYGKGLDGDVQFTESESYLRELGALDESSSWRGKQVLIANYMQGTSNCIITAPNYHVCCANECEGILGEIELAIGAPAGWPHDIVQVVRNITSPSSEEDEPTVIQGPLLKQLEKVAELHRGTVPLHSRLFAQWLHAVFPRECAFPVKAHSSQSARTVIEVGRSHAATDDEMRRHATVTAEQKEEAEEALWVSLEWGEEEEVLLSELRAPWDTRFCSTVGGATVAFMLATFWVISWRGKQDEMLFPTSRYDTHVKSRFV